MEPQDWRAERRGTSRMLGLAMLLTVGLVLLGGLLGFVLYW